MDSNSTSNTNMRVHPPIHPFFQARRPQYAPPPNAIPKSVPSSSTSLPPLDPSSIILGPSKPPSTLPPRASISPVQGHHIEPLRRINSLLLPVSYPDSFYRKILDPDGPISFSRVILWQDSPSTETKVIGGIVCRLDPALAPGSTPQAPLFLPNVHDIYIQSLVLLSPYRGNGLAAAVLGQVIEAAASQQRVRIEGLYAHVWTKNEEALKWYSARGFRMEEPALQGYYRRLKPDTAWVFRRRLSTVDYLQHSSGQGTQLLYMQAPGLASAPPIPQPSTRTASVPTSITERPIAPSHARSFQDRGPDREWNDLPDEVLENSLLKPPSNLGSKEGSASSSRSSSRSGTDRAKKKRVYPMAAYGA